MKNIFYLAVLLLVIAFAGCSSKKSAKEILNNKYESYFISFDKSKPMSQLESDSLRQILVLLHHRIPEEEILDVLSISRDIYLNRINTLIGNGLIKKNDAGEFLPNFLILDEDNLANTIKFADSLAREMSGIVIDRIPRIKEEYLMLAVSKKVSFQDISFLLLSMVMHDKLQLNYYQENFIKAWPTGRGANRYYYALIQSMANQNNRYALYKTEEFIYPNFTYAVYYRQLNNKSIPTLSTSDLNNHFEKLPTDGDSVAQVKIINELIKIYNGSQGNAAVIKGLTKYGLINNGKSTLPVLNKPEYERLLTLSQIISEDLYNYFEHRQPVFVKHFLNSSLREEATYKEWQIWIYKMMVAKLTDVLIEKGFIKRSITNSASYILVN